MKRRKIIIIALIIALTLIPIFAVLTNSTPAENNPTPPPLNDLDAPSLVIPESPLGIASLFIACLAALSLFFISKKK